MKKFLWLFLSGWASAAPLVSPSTPTVMVGGTVQFTSTDTVTWSLAAGSTGTITGGGLYTAPNSVTAKNVLDGCPLFTNDNIINTRIDNLPVDANSQATVNHMLGGTSAYFQIEVSFPHNILTNATPTTNMIFHYTTNNNGPFPILAAPYTGVENGLYPNDPLADDHHILGVNTDTCQQVEIYDLFPIGSNSGCLTCNSASGQMFNVASLAFGDTSNGNPGGVDAAGMPVQALSLRLSELKAGVINHALRFTMDNGDNYPGNTWPGQAFATAVSCNVSSTCVHYGSRWRLKASFPITSYSTPTQAILTAIKKYGMFMDDGGTAMHVQSETDVTADTTTWNAVLNEIRFGNIFNQFNIEQVDESSLMVSSSTGKVNLSNAYVTPDNYAVVIASNASNHTTTQVYIGIQPVTVGVKNLPFQANGPMLSVMAGTPQFQIPTIVNGAANQGVSCTMSPSTGTLTSGCLYTPMSSMVNQITTTTVTIASLADPSQSASFTMTIFPSDGIRMNTGGKAAFITSPVIPYTGQNYGPDATGSIWWSDPPGNGFPFQKVDGSFPQASWPSSTDVGLFYTYAQGSQDLAYAAVVPNGNYNLKLGFAGDSSNTGLTGIVESIDSQGVTISTTTMQGVIGTNYFTPKTTTIPVTVSNNQFYFATRQAVHGDGILINNFSLLPSTASVSGIKSFAGKFSVKGHMTFK